MRRFIELHTPTTGRRILVDVDQIESLVEHPQAKVNFPTGEQLAHTDFTMKSGDQGSVGESYDTIIKLIQMALQETEEVPGITPGLVQEVTFAGVRIVTT